MHRSSQRAARIFGALNVLIHGGIIAVIVLVAWQLGAGLASPLASAIVAGISGVVWGWIGREIVWPTGR